VLDRIHTGSKTMMRIETEMNVQTVSRRYWWMLESCIWRCRRPMKEKGGRDWLGGGGRKATGWRVGTDVSIQGRLKQVGQRKGLSRDDSIG
jgi:hypothetical protein